MKTRIPYLCLLILLLAACGEIPMAPGQARTPFAYPPPETSSGLLPPTPGRTLDYDPTPVYSVDISQPIYDTECTPTPGDAERAAVEALGLPQTMEFSLRRAVYMAQQQGIPWRPAAIIIRYDPAVLTITATVGLAQRHGVEVETQSAFFHTVRGYMPLDRVAQLAVEVGIMSVELSSLVYLNPVGRSPCLTPGGPTPVPYTPRGWQRP